MLLVYLLLVASSVSGAGSEQVYFRMHSAPHHMMHDATGDLELSAFRNLLLNSYDANCMIRFGSNEWLVRHSRVSIKQHGK